MSTEAVSLNYDPSRDISSLGALLDGNAKILHDLVLALTSMDDECYSALPSVGGSSIGMHVRHVIEFYQEFFKSIEASEISYDDRQRNLKFENCKESAEKELKKISLLLQSKDLRDRDLVLSVIINPDDPKSSLATTLHRELYHVLDHTIHHMALIKMIGQHSGTSFAADFGLANATKKYLRG